MIKGRTIINTDGNTEKALRKFKKLINEIGMLQEVRERQEFVKPTIRRKLAKNQAVRRWKKYLRDQELPKKLY
jgi:small subunit ribosomal protein S21